MNRDRQIIQGIENKKAQAREEYAKNKSLMGEYKMKDISTDQAQHKQPDQSDNKEQEESL